MDNYEDIFEKATLVQLSSSIWQGQKMLEPSVMNKINGNSNWVRGRKFLINQELLGPIKTASHQARNLIQKYALPFPVTSIYLVPLEKISIIDDQLAHFKNRFWEKVEHFETLYEAARREAKTVLGELFNDADYPEDISRKFKFEWRFLTLSVPGNNTLLSKELYEREKAKFETLMEETKDLAIEALRTEFGQVVSHLAERLSSKNSNGKVKVVGNGMFNKLHEFLDDFSSRNIFNDEKLLELTDYAKSIIGGVSPYSLKYNDVLKKKIQNDMNLLKVGIDESLEDLPRRKMRLAS